ncbi:MAG: hypothetical protein SVX38_11255, partial [Chloroflexota bacterium]|nr:hypothetical protein [Chloroflexota bacterium]
MHKLWPALITTILVVVVTGPAGAISPLALPPVTDPDGRLGMCFVYHNDPDWHTLAVDAGARTNRWQLSWYDVEATEGTFDFSVYEDEVSTDAASGLEINAILMGTPDWAATGGSSFAPRIHAEQKTPPLTFSAFGWTSTSASPPLNLDLAWDDPANYWGRFVYNTVSHFKDSVQYWEMWNEPDYDYFWTGTAAQYYQLLKVGYQAAKAADPDCTVLFGAPMLYGDDGTFFEQVLALIRDDPTAPDNNYYFDIIPMHLYANSAQLYDNVEWLRWRLSLYDRPGSDDLENKPIWVNEMGVRIWGEPPGPDHRVEWSATTEEQANYVIQGIANGLAARVERLFYFRLHDSDMSDAYGLVRNDKSLRPAYDAYQVAATYLSDPLWVSRVPSGPNVRVSLWGTPRGKVSVLWNTSPTTSTYTLPAILDSATVVDKRGQTQTITPLSGNYTFTLSPATAHLISDPSEYTIGGDPLIVIEADTAPPTSTVAALPETVGSTSFEVNWSGSDGESGVWSYDVQVRDGPDGEWATWQSWSTDTSATYAGENGHTYYFRSRARDLAGNEETYPPGDGDAHTTIVLTRSLHYRVGSLYADLNGNGVRDGDDYSLDEVTMTFQDDGGQDMIAPHVGSSWEFTTTVKVDETYTFRASKRKFFSTQSTLTIPAGA